MKSPAPAVESAVNDPPPDAPRIPSHSGHAAGNAGSVWRSWDAKIRWGLRWHVWLWLGPLIYATTLGGPFVLDDLYLVRRVERWRAGELSAPALFRFCETAQEMQAQRDRTTFVWWIARSQTTAFFRPLPEQAFVLDYAMFGRNAMGHRMVSLAWFVGLLLMVRHLFLLASKDRAIADVAATFFSVSQCVSLPVTFISNRSDLMVAFGAVAGAIGFWHSLRQVESGRGPGGWPLLAAAGYLFSLGCKEAAAPMGAVALAYAWIESRAARDAGRASLDGAGPQRMRWFLGAGGAAIAVAYLLFYFGAGYGVHSIDAATKPAWLLALRRGREMALNGGLLLSIWTLGIPGGLALLFNLPILAWLSAAIALVPAVLILRLSRGPWRESSTFRFFAIWAIGFSLPALIATPEPRLLCTASVGWAYCLARLVCVETSRLRPWSRRAIHEWLLCSNAGMAAAFGLGASLSVQSLERQCQENVRGYLAALPEPLREGQALVVTQPRNALELFAPGARLEFLTNLNDVRLHYLAVDSGLAPHVERVVQDERTLTLRSPSPGLFGGVLAPKRDDAGNVVTQGSRFENRDFAAEVMRFAAHEVLEVRYRFSRPLVCEEYRFVPGLVRSE